MTASAEALARARLYLVATPRAGQPERELLARVRAALDGGVDVVQLRVKDGDALAYLRLAERVGDVARAAGAPFVVNDRPDVALAAGADAVHLGQGDLPPAWARRVAPALLVGRSTHSPADLDAALDEEAAYVGVGPVWTTPTKPGRAAAGLAYVRAVARRAPPVPWFAIGGIDAGNVAEVIDAGASRVAVVRAVLDAADPAAAARVLADALARGGSHAPLTGAACR